MAPKAAKGKAPPKDKPGAKDKPGDAGGGGEGAPEEGEEEYFDIQDINPFKNVPAKKIYLGLGIIALLSIVAMAVAIHYYLVLKAIDKLPIEDPLKKLRRTMAIGLRNPNVNYQLQGDFSPEIQNSATENKGPPEGSTGFVLRDHSERVTSPDAKVASEVIRLPEHLEIAEKTLAEEKKIYQSLFYKSAKSIGGWNIFEKALYYISKEEKTWYDAENFCKSRDAHLASILDETEQNYLTLQFSEPFWIGLSDENVEGDWKWTDGSRLLTQFWSPSNFSLSKSRTSMEEDCAFIDPKLEIHNWKKADCHTLKRWACKESVDVGKP